VIFQQDVVNDPGPASLVLNLHVEPCAVVAAFCSTLWGQALGTREVAAGAGVDQAVADVGAVRQTLAITGVHTSCTVPVQINHNKKTNTICFPPAVQCSFILLLFSVCWLFLFFYYCLHSVNKDGHISSQHKRNIFNMTFRMD